MSTGTIRSNCEGFVDELRQRLTAIHLRYSSQRLLDGFLIVHALDIFHVASVTVIVKAVNAIFGHDLLRKL